MSGYSAVRTELAAVSSALVGAIVSAALLSLLFAACGELPRDPGHTLEQIRRTRHLEVGVVENPPWVIHGPSGPDGVEVRLVQELSGRLGATPAWRWGGEQTHLEALKHFELSLVIGGLDSSTPWSKDVALTRPYYAERFLIGVPAGAQPPGSLAGVKVAVAAGSPMAAYLSKKGAVPIRVEELRGASGPILAPEWRLAQLGMTPAGAEVFTRKHVMAAPPGENAWLKQLQEFLAATHGQIGSLLKSTATDQ